MCLYVDAHMSMHMTEKRFKEHHMKQDHESIFSTKTILKETIVCVLEKK